jgi:hypothetical protein
MGGVPVVRKCRQEKAQRGGIGNDPGFDESMLATLAIFVPRR